MRRRDLLRAAGSLGILAAVPVTGCAGDPDEARPSTRGGATSPVGAAPTTPPSPTAVTSVPTTAGIPSGGALLQATISRRPAPTPESARGTLLPVSAALFRAVVSGDGNAVFSPYSIVSALGMLALGARGATARQLAGVLGGDANTVARRLSAVDQALAKAVTDSTTGSFGSPPAPAVIDPANAVFLGRDSGVQPTYLDALAAGYGAGIRQVDFAAKAAATAAINGWVDQRTHGLIPHLVPPDFVDASTVLVLVNALYLKAAWANPFDRGTTAMPFSTLTGTVQTPFMTRSDKMLYASGTAWQAVSIPLAMGLAMTVILPAAGAFRRVSAGLDARLLAAATSGEERQVDLAMPAFASDVQTDLRTPLQALGLGQLFTHPDLSGIAAGLFVSGAVHQARITVDDKGIEAAAATAVAMAMSASAPAPPVRLDRPFLYVVHDVATSTPLFLGRVTDPTR